MHVLIQQAVLWVSVQSVGPLRDFTSSWPIVPQSMVCYAHSKVVIKNSKGDIMQLFFLSNCQRVFSFLVLFLETASGPHARIDS